MKPEPWRSVLLEGFWLIVVFALFVAMAAVEPGVQP